MMMKDTVTLPLAWPSHPENLKTNQNAFVCFPYVLPHTRSLTESAQDGGGKPVATAHLLHGRRWEGLAGLLTLKIKPGIKPNFFYYLRFAQFARCSTYGCPRQGPSWWHQSTRQPSVPLYTGLSLPRKHVPTRHFINQYQASFTMLSAKSADCRHCFIIYLFISSLAKAS